ncbi:MAG: dockerin type I repeat-containing protein [Bacteroidaceae bacterium]|nr:dockerin type I repeat-containing protein [Bacteroidaceae bacterium]
MSKKLLNLCMTALLSVVSTAAWALSEVDGVYQIGSAADLEEFAQLVNDGSVYANAVLTADIDRGIDGTMIGTEANKYQGTFEGAGHTIKINMYPEDVNAALFRYTGFGAVIQNLKVEGTITTSSKFAAGLVARNYGIIRGCYVDVTINSSVPGDATHGGIVAVGMGGCTVEDCLAKIAIMGETTQNCGGVVGWAEKRTNIVNCLVVSDGSTFDSSGASYNIARNAGNLAAIDVETYNSNPYANRPKGACYNNYVTVNWGSTNNVATTVVPLEELADGRICYQLNNDQSRIAWVQTIGTDPFPVPAAFGQGQVYASASTDCDGKSEGELTFSNTPSNAIATAHSFDKYGVCSVCGCFDFHEFEFDDPNKFDKKDRAVLLRTEEDIDKVEGWNRIAQGFRLNMKMMNDITYIAEEGKYIFNPSDWIDGNFNGGGHTLTIGMVNPGEKAALFPEMDGNIENLILHGTIQTANGRSGSLCGNARNALIRNVYSDVDITSTVVGDNTAGGFFGWMGDQEKTVENCIYAGTFTLPGSEAGARCARVGGFAGWTAAKTYFKNCAILGNIVGAGDQTLDNDTENSQNLARNPGNVVAENVYVVNPIFGNSVSDHDKYTHYENKAGIASGELAFFLNGKQNGLDRFFQLIGTDPEPLPIKKEGAFVYSVAANYSCDGTPIGSDVTYSNNASGAGLIPPHNYVDGWCTNCGNMDEHYLTPVDGWFEVGNGAQLAWWSVYASSHSDACVKLTDDIDMGDYMERFVPAEIYVGTFDGQGHTISNFVIQGEKDFQGLIGVIGNGAVIKNVILDETCEIKGNAFCGVIGGTSGAGDIYIENVGNAGSVTTTNQNAAGILGVDQGGSMTLHIKNCWTTGPIYGGRESGAMCGYSSTASEVINCWSTSYLPQSAIYSNDSFTRGGASVINCYEADIDGVADNKQQHKNPADERRRVNPLALEDLESGALCYNLNGKQFREPAWFQTLDEDDHPYPFDTHGIVIYGAEQYFSVLDDADLEGVAYDIQVYEREAVENVIATQSLIDAWSGTIDALTEAETIPAFADAIEAVYAAKALVEQSAAIYQAYITECERVKAYLAEHTDFEGEARTSLEAYLADEAGEPSDENPLGTFEYIIENHTATSEEIAAETERVTRWLAAAMTGGYMPGTDVSALIANSDFSKGKEGWTDAFCNDFASVQDGEENTFRGVEAWNVEGDMYQTVEGMKPGYYLIGTNAAFRPSNNRYSINYAAGIYANGTFNYFPATCEDYVKVEDAEDGVNCNLSIKSAFDFEIYDDFESTSADQADAVGATLLGYAVQGPTGMAIAAMAGRYEAYTMAYVGEDGKLTIGIKNPGTHYGNDWTGWSAIKVVYCGEAEDAMAGEALDKVLQNMAARAQTIIEYEFDYDNAAAAPNYPEALKNALIDAVAEIDGAETTEAKAAIVAKFSEAFEGIYVGKQAYVQLYKAAETITAFEWGNLELMEKDEETGDWFMIGESVINEADQDILYDAYDDIFDAYQNGTFSAEEAIEAAKLKNLDPAVAEIIPTQDEDGYYLVGNLKQFATYRTIASEVDKYAKAKLTADIDLTGVAMLPIGHNKNENAVHIFAGEFDGQGHALTNVYMRDTYFSGMQEGDPATMFYELQNATVKNLKLTGEFYTSHQFSGPVTRYMSGKSTIDNCQVEVAMHFASNLAGDASSGGLIGYNGSANSLISNCLVNCQLIGEGESPIWYVGGVAGWAASALVIKNTLITSEYINVGAEGDNSQTIARGSGASATNVFVSQYFRGQQGTLVSADQLASGEIAWKLNGSSSENPYWFQTIGEDATPHLFDGPTVYYYAGRYINEKPNIQLNAFAYNVDAKLAGSNVVVSFDLNAEAEAVEVNFYNGEEQVYTAVSNEVFTAGAHKVTVPASELGSEPTALNFKIAVTGKGSLEVSKVGESLKVWGPYGMAINNNPASKGFGQVLIAESYPEEPETGYMSSQKPGAIYAFDPDFQPINAADGTPGFYGGLPIQGETPLVIAGTYKYDLKDLRFTDDGRLFVARASGTSNSSVWEINPENLDEAWKPVFTGGELDEQTGITYVGDEEQNRMALSLAFDGQGEDLKMYVLGAQRSNGDYNITDYNCSIYNLGTATEWTAAPSANFEPLDGVYTKSPVDVGIYEDGQGGLWYIQRRSDVSAEIPAIKHFDAEGNEDYSNTSSTTVGGRIAVTSNGNFLAIPTDNGKVVLYETNYVPMENGKIFLNPKKTFSVGESRITALAFDYADNLYVASASTETFSRYTIPTDNKVVVTPGNGISVGGSIEGDLNGDGKVDIADAVSVLDIMAASGYDAAADLNGDQKVDIADFVAILDIMAQQ